MFLLGEPHAENISQNDMKMIIRSKLSWIDDLDLLRIINILIKKLFN